MGTNLVNRNKVRELTKEIKDLPWMYTPTSEELCNLKALRDMITEYFEYLGEVRLNNNSKPTK